MGAVPVYVIDRVLNNNVVVVRCTVEGQSREYIVVGKGIGFGRRRGDIIPSGDSRIEKLFSLVMEEHQSQFEQLFTTVSPEVVGIAEEIISYATETLRKPLHEHIHVALADHIGFALARLEGGINIENPFLEEIRTLYPPEWNVAEVAAQWISQRFRIQIPEQEVGFLTLHIHSATHTHGLSQTMRVADSVNMAIKTIEEELGQEIARNQLNYARLVVHLRFAIQRLLRNEPIANPLTETVKDKLPESYHIALRAADKMTSRLGLTFPDDEISYLAMHIGRLANVT